MRAKILVALALLLVTGEARALDTLGRDQGWTLGLGFGMGRADVQYNATDGGRIEEELREGVNTEWRVGRMLNRHLALSFDYQGWLLEDGDLNLISARLRQGLQIWGLGLSWYPGNPENAWGGLVLRGTVGPALANLAITVLDEDLLEVEEARLDEWGWGVSLVGGYEFFITDTVAIGPMLSLGYLGIEEDLMESGYWTTLTLLGSWYF